MRYLTFFSFAALGLMALAQTPGSLKPVDVNYMVRGYFHASSQGPGYLEGYGGWGGSSNTPSTFVPTSGHTAVEILVDTTSTVPLDSNYRGRSVVVRNNGPDTAFFPAQDSRLYMWTQALRTDSFADIEYLPSSWCGNSYHTLFLAPGEEWHFVMPAYEGRKPTRMRLVLEYREAFGSETERTVHSHTFPGGVNKGQFTQKQGHQPVGLMDPYND